MDLAKSPPTWFIADHPGPAWFEKELLVRKGTELIEKFCKINYLQVPEIIVVERKDKLSCVNSCAWYRPGKIWIKPWACASPTHDEGPYRWSYPGYLVDRTAYGALAHEIGHHLEYLYRGKSLLTNFRAAGHEAPVSGYRTNHSEVFAEFVKVFLTNPDLLGMIRPLRYDFLRRMLTPVEDRFWQDVLAKAPLKIRKRCQRLVEEVRE